MPRDRAGPLYIGIRGHVVALDRSSGAELWRVKLTGYGLVNVQLDDRRLYATTHGEAFCLDPRSGALLWKNQLKGLGWGLATMAAEGLEPPASNYIAIADELRRRKESRQGA